MRKVKHIFHMSLGKLIRLLDAVNYLLLHMYINV